MSHDNNFPSEQRKGQIALYLASKSSGQWFWSRWYRYYYQIDPESEEVKAYSLNNLQQPSPLFLPPKAGLFWRLAEYLNSTITSEEAELTFSQPGAWVASFQARYLHITHWLVKHHPLQMPAIGFSAEGEHHTLYIALGEQMIDLPTLREAAREVAKNPNKKYDFDVQALTQAWNYRCILHEKKGFEELIRGQIHKGMKTIMAARRHFIEKGVDETLSRSEMPISHIWFLVQRDREGVKKQAVNTDETKQKNVVSDVLSTPNASLQPLVLVPVSRMGSQYSNRAKIAYNILGVQPGASIKELGSGRRKALAKSHTDKLKPTDYPGEIARRGFDHIEAAFEFLTNPDSKLYMDESDFDLMKEAEFQADFDEMHYGIGTLDLKIGHVKTGLADLKKRSEADKIMLDEIDTKIKRQNAQMDENDSNMKKLRDKIDILKSKRIVTTAYQDPGLIPVSESTTQSTTNQPVQIALPNTPLLGAYK